jgi:DNA/RNA endonuclease G (NUC1)
MIRKLLEDRNRSLTVENSVLGPYGTFQIAIAITDLEAVTGFGALKAADPLKKTEAERGIVPSGTPWI